jgi:small conductance mechanosensitive channel
LLAAGGSLAAADGMMAVVSVNDLKGAIDTSTVSSSDLVAAVIAAVLTVVVAWLVGRAIHHYLGRPGSNSLQVAGMTARAARWTVIFVGASWSLSFIGADTSWFAITIALVLVLIVLVMKPALEKLAAGFALTTRPAFKIGDDIGVKDFQGTVLEISGRSTVLRLRDGRRVHLPNTDVVDETIIIYTTDQLRRTSVELEVEARHAVTDVESVLLAALATTDAVASDPPPRVRALGFGDNSVTLSVRFWHDSALGAAVEALDQAVRAISRGLGQADMALASNSLLVELRSADQPGSPPSQSYS